MQAIIWETRPHGKLCDSVWGVFLSVLSPCFIIMSQFICCVYGDMDVKNAYDMMQECHLAFEGRNLDY